MTTDEPAKADRGRQGTGRSLAALAILAALGVALTAPSTAAQAPPEIDELMARVGRRIAEFYERVQHVICLETSTVQPIDHGFSSQGFARTVESELRVEADGGDAVGEATIVRDVRTVNGRAPREKDRTDRAGCTDPNPLSTEPLAFLLPVHRPEYRFRAAGYAKDRNRPVLIIEFASVDRRSDAELIEDKAGHDDCFDWSGDIAVTGRVWVDARSYDVVRVERSLRGPVDVRVPLRIQRRHNLDRYMAIVRDDTTIRYRTVAFSDPDEELLLPESIDSLVLLRGGLQSTRSNQTYRDYRRFVTKARVVD